MKKKTHIIITAVTFVVAFSLGGAVAHFSMPEKARMTREKAEDLVHRKWGVLGYDKLKPQDRLFEDKNAMRKEDTNVSNQ